MITLEIDYYEREERIGNVFIRYHVRTVRLEVPRGFCDVDLPFYLTSRVGAHHGILRAREIDE